MSSTRNKNNINDYKQEKYENNKIRDYLLYRNTNEVNIPGNGLMPGKIPSIEFSKNACDIESDLRGIGSSNLEIINEKITPNLNDLRTLNIYEKTNTNIFNNNLTSYNYNNERPFNF